jgi:hypothetical protein
MFLYDEIYLRDHPITLYPMFTHDNKMKTKSCAKTYRPVSNVVCHDSFYYTQLQDFVYAYLALNP